MVLDFSFSKSKDAPLKLSLFDYDKSAPLDINDIREPEQKENIIIRDITFPSPKNGYINAYLVSPAEEGSYPGIFFTHWLEPEAEDSNRTQFLEMAIELGQKGVISILIDAFWSTTPEKWKKNPILPWVTEYEHDRDLCIKQVVELLRAFDVLLVQPSLDTSRIAYVGHDFGAMFGALLTTMGVPVNCWALIAGTTSFSDWFRFQSSPGTEIDPVTFQNYVDQMAKFDPVKHTVNISNVLFQFATNDFYVPKHKAMEFYEAAKEPKEIRWYVADHGMNEQSFRDLQDWLLEKLNL
ncbi:MAG: alpha/beta hydrolase family protein [Candidatus Odinarchaeota archaeon]